MCLIVYVQTGKPYTEAALVRGKASLTFATHPEKDMVLEKAANVAEEFDVDLYVDGQLIDLWELRENISEKETEK